jgi:cupin 2 domain-containing protein
MPNGSCCWLVRPCCRFEDESEARRLRAGDWLLIEAMRRHRVEWTAPATPTVWLAVHHAPG